MWPIGPSGRAVCQKQDLGPSPHPDAPLAAARRSTWPPLTQWRPRAAVGARTNIAGSSFRQPAPGRPGGVAVPFGHFPITDLGP